MLKYLLDKSDNFIFNRGPFDVSLLQASANIDISIELSFFEISYETQCRNRNAL